MKTDSTNTDPTDADFAERLGGFADQPDPQPEGAPPLPPAPAKPAKKAEAPAAPAAPAAAAPEGDDLDAAEGEDQDPEVEVPEGEDPVRAEGEDPPAADDELARLRAENEELRAKAAAPAAPVNTNFEAATIAELDKERAAALADLEVIETHIDEEKDYVDPATGETVKTLVELKKLKRANEKWLREVYPEARAAAEKAAAARAAASSEARLNFPTQFKPGTPAAALRAKVAAQYAEFARHPQFDLLVSEITTARLLKPAPRAAAPAPARQLPQGSPGRRPGPGNAPAPSIRDAWNKTKGNDGRVDEAAQADVMARL